MRRSLALVLLLPAALAAQPPAAREAPNGTPDGAADGVMLAFARFADIFGSRLVAAFDAIPAGRYGYRPTPSQQTVGYIAQHLEDANYGLCARLGDLDDLKRPATGRSSRGRPPTAARCGSGRRASPTSS